MIKLEDFKKVNMEIGKLNGKKVVIVSDNGKNYILAVNGTPIVPEKDIEEGSKVH